MVSSAKINDEKVAPKLFENWKQEMEAGGTMFFTRWRIWKNVRKCVFAWEQIRWNTFLLLHWKKSNWIVSKISQTLQTWNKIPNDLTLIFYQTPLSTAGHTLHTKGAKNVPLIWNETRRHITMAIVITKFVKFLPVQLIYEVKTNLYHPSSILSPKQFNITHKQIIGLIKVLLSNTWKTYFTMLD